MADENEEQDSNDYEEKVCALDLHFSSSVVAGENFNLFILIFAG